MNSIYRPGAAHCNGEGTSGSAKDGGGPAIAKEDAPGGRAGSGRSQRPPERDEKKFPPVFIHYNHDIKRGHLAEENDVNVLASL